MALTPWQKRQYRDRCDVWRSTEQFSAVDGHATGPTYARVLSAVPCYYEFTANIDDPAEAAGRNKRMTVFTLDNVHMEMSAGLLVHSGDMLRGTIANSGQHIWHRAEGAPKIVRGPNNCFNKAAIAAMEEEQPDPALLAAAGP